MGGKDTFKLTSIQTEVKEPKSTIKIKRTSQPSVDIQKLKELHAARQERASEVRQKTLDNIKQKQAEEENKRKATLKKIEAKTKRIEEKNAITECIAEYSRNIKNVRISSGGSRPTYVDRIVYQYEQNPGPHYDPGRLRDRLDGPAVKIAQGNPKGEIEWCEYRARQLPGPGQYSNPTYKLPKGGRLPPNGEDASVSKGYIEWEEYRASKLPGPSDTGILTKKQSLGGSLMGGEFPKFKPKGLLEQAVFNKRHVPGPGTYNAQNTNHAAPSACISETSAKSDVEWKMLRASQLPGPGEYSTKNTGIGGSLVNSGQGRSAPSAHMCRAERRTTTDAAMSLAKSTPGPGEYEQFKTPAREAELRMLKKAALQQIKEGEPARSHSSIN